MTDAGSALMGIGEAEGENRAAEAARAAVSSPLLEASVAGATGILLNITGGPDLGLFEVNEAAEVVTGASDLNANVIFGAVIDESHGRPVRVTVIATGFDKALPPRAARAGARGAGRARGQRRRRASRSRRASSRCLPSCADVGGRPPSLGPRRAPRRLQAPFGRRLNASGAGSRTTRARPRYGWTGASGPFGGVRGLRTGRIRPGADAPAHASLRAPRRSRRASRPLRGLGDAGAVHVDRRGASRRQDDGRGLRRLAHGPASARAANGARGYLQERLSNDLDRIGAGRRSTRC